MKKIIISGFSLDSYNQEFYVHNCKNKIHLRNFNHRVWASFSDYDKLTYYSCNNCYKVMTKEIKLMLDLTK